MTDAKPHGEFYTLRNLLWTDLAAAARLIEKDPSVLELRSGIGETVLHWMAVENQREIVEFLISQGLRSIRRTISQTPRSLTLPNSATSICVES